MICMPLSSVIACAAQFGAYPDSDAGDDHHRGATARHPACCLSGSAQVARPARKSAHPVSIPYPFPVTLPRHPELRRASYRSLNRECAFAFCHTGSRHRVAARALQLALSSATKVGYSRGQCGKTALSERGGLARTPVRAGRLPEAAWQPELSCVPTNLQSRFVRAWGMSSRPRMPVS